MYQGVLSFLGFIIRSFSSFTLHISLPPSLVINLNEMGLPITLFIFMRNIWKKCDFQFNFLIRNVWKNLTCKYIFIWETHLKWFNLQLYFFMRNTFGIIGLTRIILNRRSVVLCDVRERHLSENVRRVLRHFDVSVVRIGRTVNELR